MTPQQKKANTAGITAAVASGIAQVIYWHFHHHFMSWPILGISIVLTVMVWTIIDGRRNQ